MRLEGRSRRLRAQLRKANPPEAYHAVPGAAGEMYDRLHFRQTGATPCGDVASASHLSAAHRLPPRRSVTSQ
jgi:hypothetical protein